ncbi:MAG: PQQ-binding-like beta-propeller repeat protein, partial [Tepidisphaeraceae bacterium]
SWPVAFGNPERSKIPSAAGAIGANLFSIELNRPSPRLVGQPLRDLEQQNDMARRAGLMTGVLPVVDRGELFFQDNSRVYAVSLASGLPLPGWAQTYAGDRANGRYATSLYPMPRSQQFALALTDDSVLAVMGYSDPLAAQWAEAYPSRETRLVCLDRRTGRERWVAHPQKLPDSAGALRELSFSGSPLAVGDSAYVIGRGGKGQQFQDCYVLCFDLETGRLRWASYIASGNAGGPFLDFDYSALSGQNVSHLAYASGRLYCVTNLGAVAAIDAYDGTIAWLNIYPNESGDPQRALGINRFNRVAQVNMLPWTYNPAIVSAGKVFVLPSDGLNVHIYDAGTGAEVKRIRLNQFDDARTMLGVVGDRLVLASGNTAFCINWPAYDAAKERSHNLFWAIIKQVKGQNKDTIRGRGFVTADSVFLPLEWAIRRFSLRNGSAEGSYPLTGDWADNEGPGNLLVTRENLIVAGPTRVTVYTDLAVAMRKLDQAVADAPADPEPRLRYAEIMFVSGKPELAVSKLDEAIELLGGRKSMQPGANRERVFADAMAFAQQLSREPGRVEAATILGLYDRASDAAMTPVQQVHLRLNRADYAHASNDAATELRFYQEILADARTRAVAVVRGETAGSRSAASIARSAIDNIMKR